MIKKKKIITPPEKSLANRIKVRLDHKTMIIINKLSSFDVWKKRYPNAFVID